MFPEARADFSTSNQAFVDNLLSHYPDPLHDVVDIGCGPCDVMVRLARARLSLRITAVDGAGAMIELGGSKPSAKPGSRRA